MDAISSLLGHHTSHTDVLQFEGRKDADFAKYEAMIFEKLTMAGVSSISTTAMVKLPSVAAEGLLGFLGDKNPFAKHVNADENKVWILDNTAWRSSADTTWKAEFVSCVFQHGRGDITKAAAGIAEAMGIHGTSEDGDEARKLIEKRLKPFVDAVAPARLVPVHIDKPSGKGFQHTLGPTNLSGISVNPIEVGHYDQPPGAEIRTTIDDSIDGLPVVEAVTRLYEPEGFGVISDIDDTIKITMTPNPIGILKTTFAEPPQYTSHMPDFYKLLNEQLKNPPFFYVSASPYNLYPFLHKFINQYYPPGQIFLRDGSWQTLGGLLGSLTSGTKDYKTARIETIHEWFPRRKYVCIGDSTQMDPETYAAAYKNHPGWVVAIYIRKVLDAPHMEEKNKEERFEKAFKGIPQSVWKVFVLPDELKDHFSHVMSEQNVAVVDKWQGFSCGEERQKQQLEQDKVSH